MNFILDKDRRQLQEELEQVCRALTERQTVALERSR